MDEGINQEAWLGLQDAKEEGLVDRIDYIATVDSRDRAKNIATFAEDGYDVIITVGASISEETAAVAQKYPSIAFIGVEQPQETKQPNLAGLVFHEERSGFLAGALAALVTQTNRVAAVCEAKFIDPIRRYCDGFRAGAHYVNPDLKVAVFYRDGPEEDLFNDPEWGRTTALQLIHAGADVVFAAGGTTADAALETAAEQQAYVIGTETDVYMRLTGVRPRLLSSAVNDIRSGVRDLVRLAQEGQFPSGEFFGQAGLAPFHEFERQIPLEVTQNLAEIRTKLEDGSLKTEIPYKNP
jgi:basic membrane protein A